MFQRTLLRASRQAAVRPAAFAPIRQQAARTRAAAPAIRWYSDAPAAKEGEAAEKKEDAPKDETAQLKEQLEKKDKEIVDLKVRQLCIARAHTSTDEHRRTSTSARSPTSATCRSAQLARPRPLRTSPSSVLPATSSSPSTTSTAPSALLRPRSSTATIRTSPRCTRASK